MENLFDEDNQDRNQGKTVKKRRRVDKPNKKWSDKEVLYIIKYLETEKEFEKPTAQVYYRKFLDLTNISATWSLVRWKVRNMRMSFSRAHDFLNSNDAGLFDTYEGFANVKAKLDKICSNYYRLSKIFVEKSANPIECSPWEKYLEDSALLEQNCVILSEPYLASFQESHYCGDEDEFESFDSKNYNSETQQQSFEPHPSRAWKKKRRVATKRSITQIAIARSKMAEMQKFKIECEREKYLKEFELSERRLTFEQEQAEAEHMLEMEKIALRTMEIEKNEKLRMLEIEKEEKVAKFEIEMKYKFQLEMELAKIQRDFDSDAQ